MGQVSTGMLRGGSPYLAVGDGPPLVSVLGLTATHEVPSGMERRMSLSTAARFGGHFRVYVVNRKQGLQPGEAMSDIAGHLATGIEDELGGPVMEAPPDLVAALIVSVNLGIIWESPAGMRPAQSRCSSTARSVGSSML